MKKGLGTSRGNSLIIVGEIAQNGKNGTQVNLIDLS